MGKKRSFGSSFKKLDLFASNVAFRENGGDSFGSVIGSVASLMIMVVVGIFGLFKFQIVIQHQDTNHNQYIESKQLTEEVIRQDQLQLQFGFALLDQTNRIVDGVTEEQIVQQSLIGPKSLADKLEISVEIWSLANDFWWKEDVLTTHKCNETDKQMLFTSFDQINENTIDEIWEASLCLDNPEKLYMKESDQEGEESSVLAILARYCSEAGDCVSQEEKQELSQSIVNFYMYQNKRSYNPNGYGDQMVTESAYQLTVEGLNHKTVLYDIKKHKAISEESLLGLGFGGTNEKSWFEIDEETLVMIDNPFSQDVYFDVTFRLHRDVYYHTRSIYSFFDLLGDVGGLFDALKGIASIFVSLSFSVFGNPIQQYLLGAVFKQEKQRSRDQSYKPSLPDQIQQLKEREPFRLPSYCCLYRRRPRLKKLFNTGMNRIEKELETDRFLRKQIELGVAMKVLFTKFERVLIRNNRKFVLQDKHQSDSSSDGQKPKTRAGGDLKETFGKRFEELLEGTGIVGSEEILAALRDGQSSWQVQREIVKRRRHERQSSNEQIASSRVSVEATKQNLKGKEEKRLFQVLMVSDSRSQKLRMKH